MKGQKRLQFNWRVLRALIAPYLRRRFHYTPELCTAEGPLLVMANHNTDWDPLLLGCAFPRYLSFVASAHIFRWRLSAKLIRFLLDPIARQKGTTAGDTALAMLRKLRRGVSVALFAEGNRSFTGVTGEILPATGKLARTAGATLVTYRISGGYLMSPRWSGGKMRGGALRGTVVGVYPPEVLRAMSAEEVNALIVRDLHEDAYATQRREMIPFPAKAPAEHLETLLCRCPQCAALGTMQSARDRFFCTRCGFAVRYTVYGFFEGENGAPPPYETVADWDAAQTAALCADLPADGSPIFSDSDMVLREILPGHRAAILGAGNMTLYADRLECCGQTFPLAALGGFSLHGPQTVDFSAGGRSYELQSAQVRCTRKYQTVIQHLLAQRAAD